MVDEKKQSGVKVPQEPVKKAAHGNPDAPKLTAVDHNPYDLSQRAWDDSYQKQPWNDSPQGRLAIRSVSRGLMGALFFTAGGLWARKMMTGEHTYNLEKGLLETVESKNPFHIVTKLIDTFAGKPIEMAVNATGGNGLVATHFKPTKYHRFYTDATGKQFEIHGRSLGEEAMFTTFDFFCASVGDAMGRDIIGWFDPGIKKTWMDDKGNLNIPETLKTLGESLFRYVTYNGGEDWAVAIPYVYFVRAQRSVMDNLSPGYRFESDVGLNASSLKMGTKAVPHNVTGSYAIEAMIDYQSRFTVYNIGTLMYRELYDKIEKSIEGKRSNLYGAPDAPPDPKRTFLSDTLDVVKWTARSVIKGVIYMTPAMPFFSLTRVTQGRNRALFVDPTNNSAMSFTGNDGNPHFVNAHDVKEGTDGITHSTPVYYSRYDRHANGGLGDLVRTTGDLDAQLANPSARVDQHGKPFDVYERRNNMIENAFSLIGDKTSKMARGLDGLAEKIDNSAYGKPLKRALGLMVDKPGIVDDKFKRFTRNMVNASVSYTPYMYAKAEFANLWDTGKMDMAAERTVDGLFSGSWKEIKAGAGEIANAFMHKPFVDADREIEAQRRIDIDTSASDAFTRQQSKRSQQQQLKELADLKKRAISPSEAREQFEKNTKDFEKKMDALQSKYEIKKPVADIPWQKRIIQGRNEEGDVKSVSTKHSPQSHSEREEMRKLLESVQPPTNSVH
jgi:hypothetical protein